MNRSETEENNLMPTSTFFFVAIKQFRATVQFLCAQNGFFFPITSVIMEFIQHKIMLERGNRISA